MSKLSVPLSCLFLVACGSQVDPQQSGSSREVKVEWTVTKVTDGDTIWVESDAGVREKVRFIGIDTPESGRCGFTEAAQFLSSLVLNKPVALIRGGTDDSDRYGRLLRYVEINGQDTGLSLIESGLAISRYDSRDGYGPHDRENVYVQTDVETENVCPDSAWQKD